LLYGSENWTIKARDVSRITAAEKKYMRKKEIHLERFKKKKYKELSMIAVLDKI